MQNAPQQQAGESQLTDISLDIPQVKPLAEILVFVQAASSTLKEPK